MPRRAVTERGGKRVVFVLQGQRVERREVTLGLGDDDTVEIREGVEAGERVVVRGLETLTDQTRSGYYQLEMIGGASSQWPGRFNCGNQPVHALA